MSKKAVVVFSGGPDSATVLYSALRKGYEIYPITFDYGQLARSEIECAKSISAKLGLPWILVNLESLAKIYSTRTSLVNPGIPISSDFNEQLIVPFRNGIMLAIAVAYANSSKADCVFYGAQGSDAAHYPDCSSEFVSAFQASARCGTGSAISVEAPLLRMKKSEVLKYGKELGVPYEMTWSCYNQGIKHCGHCESCLNRINAFTEAGILDPTEYETLFH